MTPQTLSIAWAISGLALTTILGVLSRAFLRPFVVGAMAGGWGAQLACALPGMTGCRAVV